MLVLWVLLASVPSRCLFVTFFTFGIYSHCFIIVKFCNVTGYWTCYLDIGFCHMSIAPRYLFVPQCTAGIKLI